jgi:hypothetical protein
MFLSANNFFWQVRIHGDVMTKTLRWRELGRPEAALIGVQYRANDRGTHRGRWQVRDAAAEPWLFSGTDLRNGSLFSSAGIEIDARAPSSPPQTKIVAVIPNIFGRGISANMSYYETRAGAKSSRPARSPSRRLSGSRRCGRWPRTSGPGWRPTRTRAGARTDAQPPATAATRRISLSASSGVSRSCHSQASTERIVGRKRAASTLS